MRTIDRKAAYMAAFLILILGVAAPLVEVAANVMDTIITFLQWNFS